MAISTQREYVEHYLGNYVRTYRIRAAVALASIRTPGAVQVLNMIGSLGDLLVDSAVARGRAAAPLYDGAEVRLRALP
jgi:hypothetical protein